MIFTRFAWTRQTVTYAYPLAQRIVLDFPGATELVPRCRSKTTVAQRAPLEPIRLDNLLEKFALTKGDQPVVSHK